jgi:hypothetical protein
MFRRAAWEKFLRTGAKLEVAGDPGSENVLRTTFSLCSLSFFLKIRPRKDHPNCVKNTRNA